jgi:ribosomal-protein-alanine N-acetyltransferase
VTLIPTIRTRRLELVSMSPSFLNAVLADRRADAEAIAALKLPPDWPDERDRSLFRRRLEQMRQDSDSQQWLLRAIVLSARRVLIGHIGFHGPPETVGRAELGYAVMPDYRRLGYASEAARTMMEWAHREHGVTSFFVAISPDNAASLAMAVRLGFVRVGEQIDEEDGLEYVLELVVR